MQAAVNAWFTNGFLWLCLAPISIAVLYYFIPKLLGQPLQSRALAALGFWTYVFAAPWMGLTQYTGGPFPVWMISASIGASILFLLPLAAIALNWFSSLQGQTQPPRSKLLLRFTALAAAAFVLGGLLRLLTSTRTISNITQFTLVPVAIDYLLLFGFVSMALFTAIYYVLPRVTGVEWPSLKLIRVHFGASATGILLILIGLGVGGLIQGLRLNNPSIDALQVTKGIIPFIGVGTLGVALLLVGQVALAVNCFKLYRRFCAVACKDCCGWICPPKVNS
jgi:cytochrome c oxidase cbb3-type subunit 1